MFMFAPNLQWCWT